MRRKPSLDSLDGRLLLSLAPGISDFLPASNFRPEVVALSAGPDAVDARAYANSSDRPGQGLWTDAPPAEPAYWSGDRRSTDLVNSTDVGPSPANSTPGPNVGPLGFVAASRAVPGSNTVYVVVVPSSGVRDVAERPAGGDFSGPDLWKPEVGTIHATAASGADFSQFRERHPDFLGFDHYAAQGHPDDRTVGMDLTLVQKSRPFWDRNQAPDVRETNGGTSPDRPPLVSSAEAGGTDGAAEGHFAVASTPTVSAPRSIGASLSELEEMGTLIVAAPGVGPVVVPGGRVDLTRALGTWTLGPLINSNFLNQPAFATLSLPHSGLPPGSSGDPPFLVVGAEARVAAAAAAGDVEEASAGVAPFEAPAPVGAGLITQFLPFDLGSLDLPVSRFLDGLTNETAAGDAGRGVLPYSVLWVGAGLAFELTRRWHNHVNSARPVGDWKKVSRTLHGLS